MSSFATIPDAVVMRDSGKALLCIVGDREPWIPRSQLDRLYPIGYRGAIRVSTWWLGISKNQDLLRAAPPPEPEPGPVAISSDDLPNAAAFKRTLVKKYHPDRGGDGEVMRDINRLWEEMMRDLRSNNNK